MDSLFMTARDEQLHSLRREADHFGISIFGDGVTIQKIPLINVFIIQLSVVTVAFNLKSLPEISTVKLTPEVSPKSEVDVSV